MAVVNDHWPSGNNEMAERVRSRDWAATPLGPNEGWSQRLKMAVEMVLANPLVSSLACGPERILIYNDAAARLYGAGHPTALGRPLPETFPEGWATVAPFYERAFAGEVVQVAGQPLDTRGEGRASDLFDALLMPVREADGHVAYVHMTGSEVGDRARNEAALRESETRHRLLIESWAQATWETDAAGVVVADSPSWRAYTGQTLEEWLGHGWLAAIHPDDRGYAERQWREAMAVQQAVNAEFRLRAPDGEWRWTNARAAPVLDVDGRIDKWAGINIDIDARKFAEAVLRESEERQAFLLKLSDTLRPLRDAMQIQCAAMALLGEKLAVNRAAYYQVAADEITFFVTASWERGAPPPLPERMLITDFGEDMLEAYRAGRTIVACDTEQDLTSDDVQRAVRPLEVRGWIGVPLVKEDRWFAAIGVHSLAPRAWTAVEIRFVEDVAERTWDAVERARAEVALRENEKRQAFLLKLSDALRPLSDPIAFQDAAMQVLGPRLEVSRAFYGDAQDDGDTLAIGPGYSHGTFSIEGKVKFSDFELDMAAWYRAGRTYVIEDTQTDPRWGESARAQFRALEVGAAVGVPLVKDGRIRAIVSLHQSSPRRWAEAEIALLEETAERTWAAVERARAESALRGSEERYRALFASMNEAYAVVDVLKEENGTWVDFRFVEVNPAFLAHTGVRAPVGQTATELLGAPNPRWTQLYGQALDTGEAIRVEEAEPTLDRVFDLNIFTLDHDCNRVAVLFTDITGRKRDEIALRQSEERQAFLLKFSDALRAEPNIDAIAYRAIGLLSEQMRLDRCYITYYRPDDDEAHFPYQVGNATVPPLPPTVRLSDFPDAYEQILDNTFVIEDDFERRGLSDAERASSGALGMRAMLASTVRKGKRNPLSSMAAVSSRPRRWTSGEIALVEEAAERTWAAMERTRAEEGLRESEERFRQFADASAAGLWIRQAATLAMEYVSPAIATIYGVEPDALLGDAVRWAAMIVPEDRDVALRHLEEARAGEIAVHEFRIQRPLDGAFRWIRNTDFPLRGNGHILRVGGIAEDITETKLAAEHSAVLLAELQHRVRNIMALLRSIAARTGERAESVGEYRDLMMGRLLAFARVQALLTRTANVSVGIAAIVHDEVGVQAQHEEQYVVDGPDVALSPKAAEVLTLAIHELATNAVKYGALSVPDGRVVVRWSTFEKRGGSWLAFDWHEEGALARPQPAPEAPRRRGFGSELIEGCVPYELRGRGQVTIGPGGARCHLEFPLQNGASILETGAPQRATVFGGAIDMTGEPDLTGRRVLVVEDDYYLATDTARALRGAGAEVIGPCSTEDDARAELAEQRPDAAVVDINLGAGPSFKLAETLKDSGVPFVFTTGYDAAVIPTEFAEIERLVKPLQLRQIIGAVAKITPDI